MSTLTILPTLVAASGNALAALAVKGTLALIAALVLIRLAGRSPASVRHLIAAATFGILLVMPLAAALVPARTITVAPPAVVSPAPAARRAAPDTVPEGSARRALAATPSRSSSPRIGALDVVYGIYLLGVAVFGTSLLAGIVRLYRVRGRAEVSVAATRLANERARQEGMRGGIEVAVSPELAVPVTFGSAHPVILLPAETAEWSEEERGRAIRHELEHIARGDWATHIVSRLAFAVYWPHPLAWELWRRLRLEAERACDDAVIRSHGQAESYAEQLVSLAKRLHGRGAVPALAMATRSNLGLRVEAILDRGLRRGPRSRFTSLLVVVAGVAGMLAIAPLRVATAAPPDEQVRSDDDEEDESDSRDTALLEASEKGDVGRMKRLLDRGAKANAVIRGDGSPLIAAARRGRLAAMEMLIAAGADVNLGVEGDGNPLIVAAQKGHLEGVRLLLHRGADIDRGVPGDGNALIMAAGAGQIEVVRFLLDQGAALEKVVPGDENPLIHACEAGQAEVVRLLLQRGADVNARVWAEGWDGRRGEWRTPLSMARRNGHQDVVTILRAAGARN
jgi:beta-lactamase regulating signal transducer with metallopeptidase domain